jgi:hypothetical protein
MAYSAMRTYFSPETQAWDALVTVVVEEDSADSVDCLLVLVRHVRVDVVEGTRGRWYAIGGGKIDSNG